MKKLCFCLSIVIFTASTAFANPVINSVAVNGNWKNASTWSLGRVPVNGDTVVISADKLVVVDNIQNFGTSFLYIKVYGTLFFSTGKLWLNDNSAVAIFNGGSITSTGSSSETLRIGGIDKFSGGIDGAVFIPGIATKTTGTSPLGFNSDINIILPVKFTGFNLARQNSNVLVQWSTAEEISGNYYEVQRSENGSVWNTIAHINAAGNTSAAHSYSYIDKNVTAAVAYYRIRQADLNGAFVFTPVRTVKNEIWLSEIKINSTSPSSVNVLFSEQVKTNVTIRLTSANGQIVSQKLLEEPVGQVMLPVRCALNGIYIVTILYGQNLKFSKQILL